MKPWDTDNFCDALIDYGYLLERGYPRKEINRVVGNRYELSGTQRSAMHRGMATAADIEARTKKKCHSFKNKTLFIDAFNVLYTVANYLLGRPVFVALDGFVRDTGEVTGKNQSSPLFYKAIDDLVDVLATDRPGEVYFYFDYPVSHSGDLAKLMTEKIKEKDMKGEGRAVKSPDTLLKKVGKGVVATSDSAILDDTGAGLFDLARYVIDLKYGLELTDIKKLLDRS